MMLDNNLFVTPVSCLPLQQRGLGLGFVTWLSVSFKQSFYLLLYVLCVLGEIPLLKPELKPSNLFTIYIVYMFLLCLRALACSQTVKPRISGLLNCEANRVL